MQLVSVISIEVYSSMTFIKDILESLYSCYHGINPYSLPFLLIKTKNWTKCKSGCVSKQKQADSGEKSKLGEAVWG